MKNLLQIYFYGHKKASLTHFFYLWMQLLSIYYVHNICSIEIFRTLIDLSIEEGIDCGLCYNINVRYTKPLPSEPCGIHVLRTEQKRKELSLNKTLLRMFWNFSKLCDTIMTRDLLSYISVVTWRCSHFRGIVITANCYHLYRKCLFVFWWDTKQHLGWNGKDSGFVRLWMSHNTKMDCKQKYDI